MEPRYAWLESFFVSMFFEKFDKLLVTAAEELHDLENEGHAHFNDIYCSFFSYQWSKLLF